VDDVLRGCKRVVIIGVHGWFPGAVMRTMLGEVSSFDCLRHLFRSTFSVIAIHSDFPAG
ncbi:hypothetical protein BKA70DRAFT_1117551, partial [Coprinopsis sp. MPI-PUGE-AT-0042]